MTTFINLQMEEDPEMTGKAPYISMNNADDLPLLMSSDLMWSDNDRNDKTIPDSNSSLAQLLSSSVNKHSLKVNSDGGLLQEATMDDIYNEKSNKMCTMRVCVYF